MSKKYFKLFFYISIIFLIVFIYKFEYASVPKIYSLSYFIFSIIFLFIGFLVNICCWVNILNIQGYKTSFLQGMSSIGMSIFGKYIPGKIWVIMGRGEYVAQVNRYPRKEICFLSFETQIFSIWSGLIFGCIGLFLIDLNFYNSIFILSVCLLLTVLVFTSAFSDLASRLLSIILKKNLTLPKISKVNLFKILPFFLFGWAFWCLAFYFFTSTLLQNEVSYSVGFAFALAGSLGILLITPGGLGVREGALTGYLILAGVNLQDATTIALFSRLWFLLGELFVFFLGLISVVSSRDNFLFKK